MLCYILYNICTLYITLHMYIKREYKLNLKVKAIVDKINVINL